MAFWIPLQYLDGRISGRLIKPLLSPPAAGLLCLVDVPRVDVCARALADAVRGENLRFFPELRHRVAKMLRVLAYDSGGAALPELLRPGAAHALDLHSRLSDDEA